MNEIWQMLLENKSPCHKHCFTMSEFLDGKEKARVRKNIREAAMKLNEAVKKIKKPE